MLARAHKKFYRVQHAEIYLLDLKVQYKRKMKLSLTMVSKHIFLLELILEVKYPRHMINHEWTLSINVCSLTFVTQRYLLT